MPYIASLISHPPTCKMFPFFPSFTPSSSSSFFLLMEVNATVWGEIFTFMTVTAMCVHMSIWLSGRRRNFYSKVLSVVSSSSLAIFSLFPLLSLSLSLSLSASGFEILLWPDTAPAGHLLIALKAFVSFLSSLSHLLRGTLHFLSVLSFHHRCLKDIRF